MVRIVAVAATAFVSVDRRFSVVSINQIICQLSLDVIVRDSNFSKFKMLESQRRQTVSSRQPSDNTIDDIIRLVTLRRRVLLDRRAAMLVAIYRVHRALYRTTPIHTHVECASD
jgi:poly(A) polymerase Pap1